MKIALSLVAAALIGGGIYCSSALAEAADEHKLITPENLQWREGPGSLPPGAEAAVLYGDPTKEGLFAMRLKLPKGYHVPPHTHPQPEIVTVISGTARLGMGETADKEKAKTLSTGSFMAMPPNTAHNVYVDEETVIQLNSTGPWELKYINAKDDPRRITN